MIPTLGIMIGFYIIARAIEFFCKDYKKTLPQTIMALVGVGLILTTIVSMIDLITSGTPSIK